MAELVYSSGGLSVLNKFHRKKYVVYVEGGDDEVFWSVIFREIGVSGYELKAAGSCTALDKYIAAIEEGADIYVARDKDYECIKGRSFPAGRVFLTYGYSIENTYYVPVVIAEVIRAFSGVSSVDENSISEWLAGFSGAINELVAMDAASVCDQVGVRVLGDSAFRFLKSKRAFELCPLKVDEVIKSVSGHIPGKRVEWSRKALGTFSGRDHCSHVRGHFLTGAVANFIKSKVAAAKGGVSISDDTLYALCNMSLSKSYGAHPHKEHYRGELLSICTA